MNTCSTVNVLADIAPPRTSPTENYTFKVDGFTRKVIEIIRRNLSDPDFGVNALADELYMCRSTLHRKLKQHYSTNASEVITQVRLSRALELLQTDLSILCVAQEVGLSSHSYFNKVFKRHFSNNPTQHRKHLPRSLTLQQALKP